MSYLMAEYDYEMDMRVQCEEAEQRVREETKKETVKRMLNMGGLTPEVIAQAVGITLEEVQALAESHEEK